MSQKLRFILLGGLAGVFLGMAAGSAVAIFVVIFLPQEAIGGLALAITGLSLVLAKVGQGRAAPGSAWIAWLPLGLWLLSGLALMLAAVDLLAGVGVKTSEWTIRTLALCGLVLAPAGAILTLTGPELPASAPFGSRADPGAPTNSPPGDSTGA